MRQHDHLSEFARRFVEETCPGRFRVCSEEIGVNQMTLGAVSWYPTLASVSFGADRKRIRGELAARSSTSSTYGKGESVPFFREELAAGISNYIYTYDKGEAARANLPRSSVQVRLSTVHPFLRPQRQGERLYSLAPQVGRPPRLAEQRHGGWELRTTAERRGSCWMWERPAGEVATAP
nr:uncharacterized protein LOC127312253 [Lolium perenne]